MTEERRDQTPAATEPLADLQAQLSALGAESPTERAVRSIAPWVGSVVFHIGLIVLAFLVTWAVVRLQPEEEPVLIIADFDALQYDPITAEESMELPTEQPVTIDQVELLPPDPLLDSPVPSDDLFDLLAPAAPSMASSFAPPPIEGSATFVGLSASNANRIVYVMDASGSMIGAFQIILEELARSLENLTAKQQFQIVFFQNNQAILARGLNKLLQATTAEKQATLRWIADRSNILPQGRSNPLAAIEAAMRLDPDVIFLLSNNITGSGQFEIDQVDLLAMLDGLNPVDAGTGRRAVQINCVQFLDPDPLDTLRRIAEHHGGPKGYRYLDRATLGVSPP